MDGSRRARKQGSNDLDITTQSLEAIRKLEVEVIKWKENALNIMEIARVHQNLAEERSMEYENSKNFKELHRTLQGEYLKNEKYEREMTLLRSKKEGVEFENFQEELTKLQRRYEAIRV